MIRKSVNRLFNSLSRRSRAAAKGSRGGGIDAGRDHFVELKNSDGVKKRNLLRKLNQYRARKVHPQSDSYQPVRRGSRFRQRLLLILCLTLAIGLFINVSGGKTVKAFLADLDYFSITRVEIIGCRETSEALIRSSAPVPINSSLLFLNSNHVAESIKSSVKWVKNAEVIRRWPDTVVIKVEEYEPHALAVKIIDSSPQLYYMDREGAPFIRVEAGMDVDFPVITGLEKIAETEERNARLDEALHFLRLIRANNPNLPAQSVSEIHIDPTEGLIIHMVEYPFPVFFGSGEVRKKYIRLRKVLEVLYKPRKKGMDIAQVTYIRMDYLNDKVIVGYSESG